MLNILKRRIARGGTQREMDAEKNLQSELYELRYPELVKLPSEHQAYNMAQKSEACTKQYFMPYKDRAQQAWVNEVNKAEWEEGREPQIAGTTLHTKEVGLEFSKYYRMLFQKKDIVDVEKRILMHHLKKKQILQASATALDEDVTVEEVLEVMENPLG